MAINDFDDWFRRFCIAYPSVRDYLARRPRDEQAGLLETWRLTLQPFDRSTLDDVTRAIIAGEFEPVDTYHLGTFADEIRQRARVIVDRNHREQEREQLRLSGRRGYRPLVDGRMSHMLACGEAAERLLLDCGQSSMELRVYTGSGVFAELLEDGNVYAAAIVMADDHTKSEEARCQEIFAAAGLTWERIEQEAGRHETQE